MLLADTLPLPHIVRFAIQVLFEVMMLLFQVTLLLLDALVMFQLNILALPDISIAGLYDGVLSVT